MTKTTADKRPVGRPRKIEKVETTVMISHPPVPAIAESKKRSSPVLFSDIVTDKNFGLKPDDAVRNAKIWKVLHELNRIDDKQKSLKAELHALIMS